jgi:hypothetical protein
MYPGAYPSQMPQPAYAGQYGMAPYPGVRRRTGWMTFAQVVVIVEASLGILVSLFVLAAGAFLISSRPNLSNIPGWSTLPSNVQNAAGGVVLGVGVVVLVLSIFWLALGITLGRPSNVSRWIIVVLIALAALGDIAALANGRSSRGVVGIIVYLVIQALVLYALLIDGDTRRAFAGLP